MKMEAQIQMISVNSLVSNQFQPRQDYDEESIQKLASAIRVHGIVQPLTVRRVQDKFEIITGERRLRAAKSLGLTAVPCIICEVNDVESAEITVVENIHSKDLTPIEEANNFQKILAKNYLTQEQLAERMGISIDILTSKLKLLSLDEAVQTALQSNQISERHARSLLKLTDKMKQVDLLNEIINNRLTVKQVDDRIDQIINGYSAPQDLSGGIQLNNMDININTDGTTDISDALTPTTYQYNSKIKEDESKNSIFFNNLENAPVTMEDPTLSFGFNPFDKKEEEPEEGIVDLEDEDIEELDEPTEQDEKQGKVYEIYTPEELLAAINDLIKQATQNGVEVKIEDFDFTTTYQKIIKLPKVSEEESKEGNN